MAAPESTTSLELELTYLAREIPAEIQGVKPIVMADTYIPEDPAAHPHLRVRRRGDNHEITKKFSVTEGDASAHMEHTIPLDEAEYEGLQNASQRRITKERYVTVIDGSQAEVDVFKGLLEGLVLIDFEFNTEADQKAFTPPDSCLADVTQEEFIAGGMLAGKSYADIEPQLDKLGYVRLALPADTPVL